MASHSTAPRHGNDRLDRALSQALKSFRGNALVAHPAQSDEPSRADPSAGAAAARVYAAAMVDVVALRPFVPTADLETSLRFFDELGFTTSRINDGLGTVQLGAFSFLLQKFEAKGFAANYMMQVLVNDLDSWWKRIEALDLAKAYGVKPPTAPAVQPWGLTVAYVVDPAGVLWHFARDRDSGARSAASELWLSAATH